MTGGERERLVTTADFTHALTSSIQVSKKLNTVLVNVRQCYVFALFYVFLLCFFIFLCEVKLVAVVLSTEIENCEDCSTFLCLLWQIAEAICSCVHACIIIYTTRL